MPKNIFEPKKKRTPEVSDKKLTEKKLGDFRIITKSQFDEHTISELQTAISELNETLVTVRTEIKSTESGLQDIIKSEISNTNAELKKTYTAIQDITDSETETNFKIVGLEQQILTVSQKDNSAIFGTLADKLSQVEKSIPLTDEIEKDVKNLQDTIKDITENLERITNAVDFLSRSGVGDKVDKLDKKLVYWIEKGGGSGTGDMLKADYDPDGDKIIAKAQLDNTVAGTADIDTHASLTTGVHSLGTMAKAASADYLANALYTGKGVILAGSAANVPGSLAAGGTTGYVLTVDTTKDLNLKWAPAVAGTGSGDLLADGSVPLTANWDVGAFTITGTQFISDIASGTAPFVVTSTTKVANLNADLFDDESSAYYCSTAAATVLITTHAGSTAAHIGGAGTVASVAAATVLITTHAGSTDAHIGGAGTVLSVAAGTVLITTHAGSTAAHIGGAGTVLSVAAATVLITTHAGSTDAHIGGAGTVLSTAAGTLLIASHAALTTGVHSLGTMAKAASADYALLAATTLVGAGFLIDEDNMASDSAAKVPTQQSVKAYVDAAALAAGIPICIAASNSSADAKLWVTATSGVECDGTADQTDFATIIVSDHNYFVAAGDYSFNGVCTLSGLTNVNIYFEANAAIVKNAAASMFAITGCTNVHIYGGDFSQADANTNYMVVVTASTNTWFKGCNFHDYHSGIYIYCNTATHAKSVGTVVDGCEFDTYTYMGVVTSDGADWTWITNNKFHDETVGVGGEAYAIASGSSGGSDATVPGFNHLFITGNSIYNHGVHNAIDIHGGNYLTIADNHFKTIAITAIYVHNMGTAPGNCTGWDIHDNIIDGVQYGIVVSNDTTGTTISNVNVHDNIVKNFSYHPYRAYTTGDGYLMTDISFDNNQASIHTGAYDSANGVYFSGRAADVATNLRWSATNNKIYGYGATIDLNSGIYFENLHYANAEGNTVVQVDYYGVYGSNVDGCTFDRNKLTTTKEGIRVDDGISFTVNHNRIYSATDWAINVGDADVVLPQVWGNNLTGCSDNIYSTNSTTPRIADNIDKNGAWVFGDNVQ